MVCPSAARCGSCRLGHASAPAEHGLVHSSPPHPPPPHCWPPDVVKRPAELHRATKGGIANHVRPFTIQSGESCLWDLPIRTNLGVTSFQLASGSAGLKSRNPPQAWHTCKFASVNPISQTQSVNCNERATKPVVHKFQTIMIASQEIASLHPPREVCSQRRNRQNSPAALLTF